MPVGEQVCDRERLVAERDFYRQLLCLNHQADVEPLIREALALILRVTGASSAYIEIGTSEDDPRQLWWLAHGMEAEDVNVVRDSISRGIVAEALATGQVIRTLSALADPRFQARVGSATNGKTWVVWKRLDTGACQPVNLGTSGLSANTTIQGTANNDVLLVQGVAEPICLRTIGAPITNGFSLILDGKDGDDVLLAGAPASILVGNVGHDTVAGGGPGVVVIGGLGNDDVESYGPASDETLLGDGIFPSSGGDDCVFDESNSASAVSCGEGTNDQAVFPIVLPSGAPSGCENSATCCALAHLFGAC